MADFYDDPVLGQLELPRGTSCTGYENVNKKELANGSVVYYAKMRPDLNEKKQTTLPGTFATPRECAIYLATYLKEHPPVPKRIGGKVRHLRCPHSPPAT